LLKRELNLYQKEVNEMEAMEAILTRRSIRKFKETPIDEKMLNELLEAAMSAPSSSNGQPWHFLVVTDRKILDEIPKFHPYSNMVKEAPAAVFVCGDLQLEKGKGVWVQDCSAATENLLIAANAKGLGAVWLGVYPIETRVTGSQKLLDLPDYVIPLCIIVVGFPAEKKPPANRFNPERVHRNKW
jgi:nitroreductase